MTRKKKNKFVRPCNLVVQQMSILQIKLGKKKISTELSFATYSLCMKTKQSTLFQLLLGRKSEYLNVFLKT